jgi:hypothetical protein
MGNVVPHPRMKRNKAKIMPRLPGLSVDTQPQIGAILGHRGVHILAQLTKDGTQLKGTHYAVVLIGGSHPLWGVWTIAGRFIRFFGGKVEIEEAYPNHVWRRHPARWVFEDLAPRKTIDRRNYMLTKFGDER